jgi:A/G-specific adenine glycosylase
MKSSGQNDSLVTIVTKLKYIKSPIAETLCRWFAEHKRDLPWRRTRDPYRVWLSEIMLQQTQVATVIPYYERFLERFPTVQDLANAPLDDVLKLWAGLGYYSRARNLHRGAQVVATRFGGKLPDTSEAIREIPGIGAYTAGAILSIAYGKPEALVDGNVARVLSRMFLLRGDWRKGEMKGKLWTIARELVDSTSRGTGKIIRATPGDLNESLMELGATVCTPASPDCQGCPVAEFCAAKKKGLQSEFPEPPAKKTVPSWKLTAWIVEDESGRILLARRAENGLFGGLWEVPMERDSKPQSKPFARIVHVLTHRELKIAVHRHDDPAAFGEPAAFPCWSGEYTQFRWLDPDDALNGEKLGLASVQKKVIKSFIARKSDLLAGL